MSIERRPSDAREQLSNAWSQETEQTRETHAAQTAKEFSAILGAKETYPPEIQSSIGELENDIALSQELEPESAAWRSLLQRTSPESVEAYGPNPLLSLFSLEIRNAVAEDHARAQSAVEEHRAAV